MFVLTSSIRTSKQMTVRGVLYLVDHTRPPLKAEATQTNTQMRKMAKGWLTTDFDLPTRQTFYEHVSHWNRDILFLVSLYQLIFC